MDNTFFIYLERLELMAFFSGYPLVYLFIRYAGDFRKSKELFKINIVTLLPYAYALVGVLFLGLQLKNLYPDYSLEHMKLVTQQPLLKIWGLLAILFWIPVISKKTILSLIHSLVFFFFITKDLFTHLFYSADQTVIKNDMNIYSTSLLLNFGSFIFVMLICLLLKKINSKTTSAQ